MITLRRWVGLFQIISLATVGVSLAAEVGGEAAAKNYTTKCASCHGKNAQSNPAMAKVFKVDAATLDLTKDSTLAKSDGDLVKITSNGRGKMPAYKDKMSDAEISGLVAYIRSLAPKK